MKHDLKQFQRAHGRRDATAEIKAYLKTLGASWANELEMCRALRLSTVHVPAYREAFAAHLIETKNRAGRVSYVWAGTPAFAKKLRDSLK